jgi:hypothetical protein
MKHFFRPILVATIAALSIASANIPVDAQAASPYDGTWSVVINTLRGDCSSGLRYAVRIAGGRVFSDDASYRASGAVGAGGAISVTVAQGNTSASGFGQLTRDAGRGQWHTSTGQCTGKWTAERRPW